MPSTGSDRAMERGAYRRLRAVIAALVIAVVALAATGVRPAPAKAAGYVGVNVPPNVQTGRCLDSDFQGQVHTSPCDNNVANVFWEPLFRGHIGGYDYVTLKNAATGRRVGKIETSIQCDEDPTRDFSFAAAGPSGVMAVHPDYAGGPAKVDYGNRQREPQPLSA